MSRLGESITIEAKHPKSDQHLQHLKNLGRKHTYPPFQSLTSHFTVLDLGHYGSAI